MGGSDGPVALERTWSLVADLKLVGYRETAFPSSPFRVSGLSAMLVLSRLSVRSKSPCLICWSIHAPIDLMILTKQFTDSCQKVISCVGDKDANNAVSKAGVTVLPHLCNAVEEGVQGIAVLQLVNLLWRQLAVLEKWDASKLLLISDSLAEA